MYRKQMQKPRKPVKRWQSLVQERKPAIAICCRRNKKERRLVQLLSVWLIRFGRSLPSKPTCNFWWSHRRDDSRGTRCRLMYRELSRAPRMEVRAAEGAAAISAAAWTPRVCSSASFKGCCRESQPPTLPLKTLRHHHPYHHVACSFGSARG